MSTVYIVATMLCCDLVIKMPKSKKDKVAGLEKHKQLQREKEMKRKQRKQVSLPAKHTKKK
jgi:hypothetical protein